MTVALITGSIATILALELAKIFAKVMEKVSYNLLCMFMILFIPAIAFYFSGIIGLLILTTATAIVIIPPMIGVKDRMQSDV